MHYLVVDEMSEIVDRCNAVVEESGILDLTETNNTINSIKISYLLLQVI